MCWRVLVRVGVSARGGTYSLVWSYVVRGCRWQRLVCEHVRSCVGVRHSRRKHMIRRALWRLLWCEAIHLLHVLVLVDVSLRRVGLHPCVGDRRHLFERPSMAEADAESMTEAKAATDAALRLRATTAARRREGVSLDAEGARDRRCE
jgi:hypothetical protein